MDSNELAKPWIEPSPKMMNLHNNEAGRRVSNDESFYIVHVYTVVYFSASVNQNKYAINVQMPRRFWFVHCENLLATNGRFSFDWRKFVQKIRWRNQSEVFRQTTQIKASYFWYDKG